MGKIKTVYDHIHANNVKTAILVALFPLIFVALVFLFMCLVTPLQQAVQVTITVALPILVICLVWMGISWAFGDSMMLNVANAHEIDNDDKQYRDIFHVVENVALAAGLPTPRVYIIDDDSMNAFATGRNPDDASIALTRGIMEKLNKTELAGVVAHEMAHIGNRDIRLDMLLITGAGVTVFLADILARSLMYGNIHHDDDNEHGNNWTMILMMLLLAFGVFNILIVPLLRMAVSRNREYAADATGAYITRNPIALANALRKITTDSRVECLDKNKSMAAVCIADPRSPREFIGNLMATHPATQSRIERLESMIQ